MVFTKSFLGCWIAICCVSIVASPAQVSLCSLELETLSRQPYSLAEVAQQERSVFYFLAPECPLCENYARTISQLRQDFPKAAVRFYGVFPGHTYSEAEITGYLARFQLPVQPLLDPDYRLTHFFEARVTPEVVLVDADGTVLYQGKIDNWIASLGKKRLQVSQHYLANALRQSLAGQPIVVPQTTAVGCFIE